MVHASLCFRTACLLEKMTKSSLGVRLDPHAPQLQMGWRVKDPIAIALIIRIRIKAQS